MPLLDGRTFFDAQPVHRENKTIERRARPPVTPARWHRRGQLCPETLKSIDRRPEPPAWRRDRAQMPDLDLRHHRLASISKSHVVQPSDQSRVQKRNHSPAWPPGELECC